MRVPLKESIRQTIAYANFFDFPLTLTELHHWLITSSVVSVKSISKNNLLADLLPRKRLLRQKISQQKIINAQKLADVLKLIPSVELVALTGSLAMNNARKYDDIDLMIVTKERTLWLTRLFVVPFVRIFFKSRYPKGPTLKGSRLAAGPTMKSVEGRTLMDSICLNLWLDTSALSLPRSKRNLYTAHEVLQVKPLINKHQTYEQFILSNSWVNKYLANAWQGIMKGFQGRTLKGSRRLGPPQAEGPTLKLLFVLNLLAFKLQFAYMSSKLTSETVSLNSAYFHPRSLASSLDRHLKN